MKNLKVRGIGTNSGSEIKYATLHKNADLIEYLSDTNLPSTIKIGVCISEKLGKVSFSDYPPTIGILWSWNHLSQLMQFTGGILYTLSINLE